jgi:hypothetical protein
VAFTEEFLNGPDTFVVRTNAALGKLENFIFIEIANGTIHPSITSFSDGSLMVAYTLQNSATDFDIVAKRVDSAGTVSAPITLFNGQERLFRSGNLGKRQLRRRVSE